MAKQKSTVKSGAAGEALVLARMLLMGLDVYQCAADDHGVDLAVRLSPGRYMEIQVKNKTGAWLKSVDDPGRPDLLIAVVDHDSGKLAVVPSIGLTKRYDKTSMTKACNHEPGEWCVRCVPWWCASPDWSKDFEEVLKRLLDS